MVCVYWTHLYTINMLSVQERPSKPTVTTDCGGVTCLCPSPSAPFISRAAWQTVKKMEKHSGFQGFPWVWNKEDTRAIFVSTEIPFIFWLLI